MFEIITLQELLKRLDNYNHKELHIHHTWSPSHKHFTGDNGIKLQENMKRFHVETKKWEDIAQHITSLPNGLFVTGRDFGKNPASISGFNTGAFMVEMLGNFDIGNDLFEGEQKKSILGLAKYFNDKGKYIRFHRENSSKSCPGTSIDKEVFMNEVRSYSESTYTIVKTIHQTYTSAPKVEIHKVVNELSLKIDKAKKYVGARCKELQEKLNIIIRAGRLNNEILTEDNLFGKKSYLCLIKFQTQFLGENEADGLCGNKSFNKMNEVIADINKPKEQTKPVNQVVLAFQKAVNAMGITDKNGNKLTEDGVLGSLTLSTVDKTPLLKVGSKNALVGFVQGVVGCKQDNDYGNITKSKVIAYQKSKNISADGIVGRESIRKMLGL